MRPNPIRYSGTASHQPLPRSQYFVSSIQSFSSFVGGEKDALKDSHGIPISRSDGKGRRRVRTGCPSR